MNFTGILITALVLAVMVLIVAEIRRNTKLIYLVKPLSTLFVMAIAVNGLLTVNASSTYGFIVISALTFSMFGDIALMPPDNNKKFRIGLVLFLTAHIIYIAAFSYVGEFSSVDLISGAVIIAVASTFYWMIRRNLGAMKIPVIVYILIICLMVNRAVSTRYPLVIAGALLFFISDILLASNRFFKKWKYERISLAFYYGGQLFIALSVSSVGSGL